MQIYDMGHNRSTQHAHGDVDAVGVHPWDDYARGNMQPVRLREKYLDRITSADTEDECHNHLFKFPIAIKLYGKNDEDKNGSQQRGDKEVDIEEQVEPEGSAEKFSEIRSRG